MPSLFARFLRRCFGPTPPVGRRLRRPTVRPGVEALEDRLTPAGGGGSFSEVGGLLTVSLLANKSVSIVATPSTYTLTLAGGTWNGTNSANVSGSGTNALTVTSAGRAAFTSGVTVTDGGSNDSVVFADSGGNAYVNNFNVSLTQSGANAITFNGATAFAGTAGLNASTAANILVSAGASVSTANGNLTLSANPSNSALSAAFVGVEVDGFVRSTGTGSVGVTGCGGGAGVNQYGVLVQNGGLIDGGTGGTLSVSGVGGPSAMGGNSGVVVSGAGSVITSAGANVVVSGQGGSLGSPNDGVDVLGGGELLANGDLTLSGTGVNGFGVFVDGSGTFVGSNANTGISASQSVPVGQALYIDNGATVFGGNVVLVADSVEINATGTASVNAGAGAVILTPFTPGTPLTIDSEGGLDSLCFAGISAASVQVGDAATGPITVSADPTPPDNLVLVSGSDITFNSSVTVAGGNSFQAFAAGTVSLPSGSGISASGGPVYLTASTLSLTGGAVQSAGGAVLLTADNMDLSSGSVQAGSVFLAPFTFGRAVDLGGADSPTQLGLTAAELGLISAGTLNVNAPAGTVTVSAPLTLSAGANVILQGNAVLLSGGPFGTGGVLTLASGPGGVSPAVAGTDVAASVLTFVPGTGLVLNVSGPAVDAQYTQLNVAGAVDLTGLSLALAGSYAPAVGDSFTIVSAASVQGAFNGLPDGAAVTLNGVPLVVHYTATAVTLAEPVPQPPPLPPPPPPPPTPPAATPTPTPTLTAAGAVPFGVLATPVIGQSFTVTVGSFAVNFPATAADFTAVIDWNDGTTSPGVVTADAATGGFDVSGTHAYATETTALVSFTVTDAAQGLSATASAGAAVALPGQTAAFAFAYLPAGGGTAEVGTDTIDADLVTLPGAGAATLSLGRFGTPPVDADLVRAALPDAPNETVEFCDVRVTGVGPDATLKINFHYHGITGTLPSLLFLDSATGQFESVFGSAGKTGSFSVDTVNQVIHFVFDATSMPRVTQLTGTVFAIAVDSPQPAASTPAAAAPTTTTATTTATTDTPAATTDTTAVSTTTTLSTPASPFSSDASLSVATNGNAASGAAPAFQTNNQLVVTVNASQDSSGAARGGPGPAVGQGGAAADDDPDGQGRVPPAMPDVGPLLRLLFGQAVNLLKTHAAPATPPTPTGAAPPSVEPADLLFAQAADADLPGPAAVPAPTHTVPQPASAEAAGQPSAWSRWTWGAAGLLFIGDVFRGERRLEASRERQRPEAPPSGR